MPLSVEFQAKLVEVLPRLLRNYPTPFHIYDEAGFLKSYNSLTSAFSDVPYRQYFAVKALPNPIILAILKRAGSGFDCSSIPELRLVQMSGAAPQDIFFTSNNTTRAELDHALRLGSIINIDDIEILKALDKVPESISFRLSVDKPDSQCHLIGNSSQSKFGIPIHMIAEAYNWAKSIGVKTFGIHAMIASNELDWKKAMSGVQILMATAASTAKSVGVEIKFVNIGGGIGINYHPGDQPFDLASFATAVKEQRKNWFNFQQHLPAIMTECGRYVTGPHGVLVTRVTNRMQKRKNFVGVDASMSCLMRPALYPTAYHHVTAPFSNSDDLETVDIVGSLCENIDKFAIDRMLPRVAVGDVLLIHDTGAHGHAMGFTYNGRLRPAELLLTQAGDVLEIRRSETFDDYVSTIRAQTILPHVQGPNAEPLD